MPKPRNPHALPARQRKGGPHKLRRRQLTDAEAAKAVQEALAAQELRVDVGPLEDVRGADGWLLSVGCVVRREAFDHPLYGPISSIVGRVSRVYRRPAMGDRILIDFEEDAPGAGAVHTTTPDRLRISTASMPLFELHQKALAGELGDEA